MEDWLAIATDRDTGWYKALTICGNKEEAVTYAKYYRSVGYNARALPREKGEKYLDELYDKHMESVRLWERNKTV